MREEQRVSQSISHRLVAHEIYRRIPHDGAMRLLDAVTDWDDTMIECAAGSHTDPEHPLRWLGRLAGVHALEYAAQAVALHASLVSGDAPLRRAYVAAFRRVDLFAERLDTLGDAPLAVRAMLKAAQGGGAQYTFDVRCAAQTLTRGMMTVAIERGVP